MRMRIVRWIAMLLAVALISCGWALAEDVDYADPASWACCEAEVADKPADVFFVAPTVYSGSAELPCMEIADEASRAAFLGATNMEKGIYDGSCRFFAPYYRQAGLYAYTLDEDAREPYLESAYADVKAAFLYYCAQWNDGRPIVLAGFSQGADLCIRLMKDCFRDEALRERLVACYAIGWRITQEEMDECPWLRFAQGEDDTGAIVAFNSEAEGVADSLMIPAGTRTLAINPLNWRTDGTPADRSLNLGACFTNYDGEIDREVPELCGAYIDPERGALKVTGVSPEEYPPVLDIFEAGVYHLYDYQFFYRNLQRNVQTRVEAYLAQTALSDAA